MLYSVAIFDVLRNPTHHNTFVLLQPRPQLSAILPKLMHATSMDQLPHLQPLPPRRVRRRAQKELPSDVDAITEERKRREKAMKERNYGSEDARCLDRSSLYTDRRCLVGIRPLKGGDGDGPENRLKRLIGGALTVVMDSAVMHRDPRENTNPNTVASGNGTPDGAGDKPGPGPALPGNSTLIEGREPAAEDLSFWPRIVFAFVVGALGLWFGFGLGKVRRSSPRSAPVIVDVPTAAISVPAAPPTPTLPPPEESPPPLSPQVLATKKLLPLPPDVAEDADESGDENENENGDASALPGTKRKGRRGRRAKKKKPGVVDAGENNNSADLSSEKENLQESLKPIENGLVVLPNGNSSNPLSTLGLSFSPTIPVVAPPVEPSLVVSDHVLGYGSHGTVVYRGSLQGRAVAVKRLLQDFVTLASREVSILQESDDHPNLCPATLADLIETPDRDAFDPKRALRQIAGGLRHLHGLKLVHRNIKPQNILVSAGAGGGAKVYRMLISDFGLCKKLDVDQTSFLLTSHGAMAAGTVGWRAPEILRGDVKLDEMGAGDDASVSSQGSAASGASSGTAGKPARLTKSVDIFALGCLFFYTLTSGGHPFGDRFEREANIMKGAKNLEGLERFGEEGEEAVDLISSMLHAEAHERPDTTTRVGPIRDHDANPRRTLPPRPGEGFVWQRRKRLASASRPLFLEHLGKFRKYDGRSVQDLLRALRNKKHHYQDLPNKVKRNLGPMPEGFLAYFTRRFPRLFLHVHSVVGDTSLRTESMFRSYFELHD
ncbi:hypothetical protein DFH08DRAFT_968324 [Mycena albidolilacea]|uniref:non-specific serine/threonine protein kinase n=1 Tax=Mycena albidolilacea TaxID=1033008 RepID=A0AAD6ZL85_9AGAR|nr:hypothetical protein DFH08DRAFT_968324 [Mycena albidolilacea]